MNILSTAIAIVLINPTKIYIHAYEILHTSTHTSLLSNIKKYIFSLQQSLTRAFLFVGVANHFHASHLNFSAEYCMLKSTVCSAAGMYPMEIARWNKTTHTHTQASARRSDCVIKSIIHDHYKHISLYSNQNPRGIANKRLRSVGRPFVICILSVCVCVYAPDILYASHLRVSRHSCGS